MRFLNLVVFLAFSGFSLGANPLVLQNCPALYLNTVEKIDLPLKDTSPQILRLIYIRLAVSEYLGQKWFVNQKMKTGLERLAQNETSIDQLVATNTIKPGFIDQLIAQSKIVTRMQKELKSQQSEGLFFVRWLRPLVEFIWDPLGRTNERNIRQLLENANKIEASKRYGKLKRQLYDLPWLNHAEAINILAVFPLNVRLKVWRLIKKKVKTRLQEVNPAVLFPLLQKLGPQVSRAVLRSENFILDAAALKNLTPAGESALKFLVENRQYWWKVNVKIDKETIPQFLSAPGPYSLGTLQQIHNLAGRWFNGFFKNKHMHVMANHLLDHRLFRPEEAWTLVKLTGRYNQLAEFISAKQLELDQLKLTTSELLSFTQKIDDPVVREKILNQFKTAYQDYFSLSEVVEISAALTSKESADTLLMSFIGAKYEELSVKDIIFLSGKINQPAAKFQVLNEFAQRQLPNLGVTQLFRLHAAMPQGETKNQFLATVMEQAPDKREALALLKDSGSKSNYHQFLTDYFTHHFDEINPVEARELIESSTNWDVHHQLLKLYMKKRAFDIDPEIALPLIRASNNWDVHHELLESYIQGRIQDLEADVGLELIQTSNTWKVHHRLLKAYIKARVRVLAPQSALELISTTNNWDQHHNLLEIYLRAQMNFLTIDQFIDLMGSANRQKLKNNMTELYLLQRRGEISPADASRLIDLTSEKKQIALQKLF